MRALDRKIAADLGVAAEDRLIDVRCREDLIVEDDRERLADILLRRPPEATSAGGVELDIDVRASVLVERLRRAGQLITGDHHPALDGDRSAPLQHRQDLAAGRGSALLNVLRVSGKVDELELQPRRLTD